MDSNRFKTYFLRTALLFCLVACIASCGGSDIEIPDPPKPWPEQPEPDKPTTPEPENPDPENPEPAVVTLYVVDPQATPETKALYANLWKIAERGFMFGHHDDLWYGRYWYDESGASDTKAVCGDYPAVCSVDLGPMMDNRHDREADRKENEIRRRVMVEAYERGEVITACAHLNNPLTGGDSWDNSNTGVVRAILDESSDCHRTYMEWLGRLADFANKLKANDGTPIPLLFRPYHEHTQSWSWWGKTCTTEQEFIALWQMTVRYLRDTKGVHNLLYAVSPQMDAAYENAQARLLYRWPGDRWVDFIGMDCYHGLNTEAFDANLAAISALSGQKRKPCGVTETGAEGFTKSDYWTQCILRPLMTRRVSMVVMWRNKYVGTNESDRHFYSVYPGHPSEQDFRTMYGRPRSIFSQDLPAMYRSVDGIAVE